MNAPIARDPYTGGPAGPNGPSELVSTQVAEAFNNLLGNHVGAQATALLGGWGPYIADVDLAWKWDAETLARRSWDLVRNDPHARAMVEAVLLGVFGSAGLSAKSLFRADDAADTSPQERQTRREINASIARASYGKRLDAGGQLSRKKLGQRFLINKIVTGDGFAVRVWKPNRPNAYQGTAWRIVPFDRVCNRDSKPNSELSWEGMIFDPDGTWIGIEVLDQPKYGPKTGQKTWTYFPVYAPDGTRIVLHDFKPFDGSRRGISWFAPLLVLAKHLQQTTTAYVVAKRIQACHPAIVKTDDPEALALAQRQKATLGPNTRYEPGRTYYTTHNTDIVFPDWAFNGADFLQFVDSQLRMFTACWGLPFQFVVQQLTQANLASSRAALDQASMTFESLQDDQIESFECPINEAIIAEDITRKRIIVPAGAASEQILAARWLRPRQWSTDRAKDATAAEQWFALGKSKTTIFAQQGLDYETEITQRAQDDAYEKAQGVTFTQPAAPGVPGVSAKPEDAANGDDGDGADAEDAADQSDDAANGTDQGNKP